MKVFLFRYRFFQKTQLFPKKRNESSEIVAYRSNFVLKKFVNRIIIHTLAF